MKLKEKLAKEYVVNSKGYDTYYENDYCQNNYTDMREAFLAGFEAAKRSLRAMESSKRTWFEIPMSYLDNLGEQDEN